MGSVCADRKRLSSSSSLHGRDGRARREAVRTWRAQRAAAVPVDLATPFETFDEAAARQTWENGLPPSAQWWGNGLPGERSCELHRAPWGTDPGDRLRGAVSTVRGKMLEVLCEARQQGDAEAEWKAFLALDLLLLVMLSLLLQLLVAAAIFFENTGI